MCLTCWKVASDLDGEEHDDHNETSAFHEMEEATRASFLELASDCGKMKNGCPILFEVPP